MYNDHRQGVFHGLPFRLHPSTSDNELGSRHAIPFDPNDTSRSLTFFRYLPKGRRRHPTSGIYTSRHTHDLYPRTVRHSNNSLQRQFNFYHFRFRPPILGVRTSPQRFAALRRHVFPNNGFFLHSSATQRRKGNFPRRKDYPHLLTNHRTKDVRDPSGTL